MVCAQQIFVELNIFIKKKAVKQQLFYFLTASNIKVNI